MGWFNKDKKKEDVHSLPELPKLPEFPRRDIHQLPSFPSNSLGEKFSQNSIKEAVMGRKEVEGGEADEFSDEGMMPEPPMPPLIKGFPEEEDEIPGEFREAARRVKEAEPLFIRIDKFEESMKTFENIKEKINSMEKMLRETRRLKEEEEKELQEWENKIKTAKSQIERIDKDIFSKLE
jgi:hypothetical protein